MFLRYWQCCPPLWQIETDFRWLWQLMSHFGLGLTNWLSSSAHLNIVSVKININFHMFPRWLRYYFWFFIYTYINVRGKQLKPDLIGDAVDPNEFWSGIWDGNQVAHIHTYLSWALPVLVGNDRAHIGGVGCQLVITYQETEQIANCKLLAPPPGPHSGGKGSNCLLHHPLGGDPPRTGTRWWSRPVSW